MNITATKSPETHKWVVSCQLESDKIVTANVRIGCAVRDLLNTVEYKYGGPNNDVTITVEGW